MKRIIAFILAFFMIIGTVPVMAEADEVITVFETVELYSKGQFPDNSKAELSSASQEQIDQCVEYIKSKLMNYKEGFKPKTISVEDSEGTVTYMDVYSKQIDITSFNIPISDIRIVMQHILNAPEMFYMLGTYSYSYYKNGNIANVELYRDLFYTDEEIENRWNAINNEVDCILSGLKGYMSDVEKAMYVHDYIVLNYTYDYTYSNFAMDSFVLDKKGVCQAYAYMYMYILNQIGIECIFVPSTAMTHAWNQVKINGEWYHADVTWDDPSPDYAAQSKYSNFLVSDERIIQTGHTAWDSDVVYTASSTLFDDAIWREANVPVIHKDSECYYKKKDGIYKYNNETETEEKIYTITNKWYVFGKNNYIWPQKYSTLGEYNDTIYFNTENKIYSLNLNETDDNGNAKTELFIDTDEIETLIGTQDISKTYIYGMFIYNGNLYFDFCTTPEETARARHCIKMPTETMPCGFYTKKENDTIIVTPKKNNYTGSAVMYIAVYDVNGKLIELKSQEITDWNNPVTYTIKDTEKANHAGVMLWRKTFSPLSPGEVIKLVD